MNRQAKFRHSEHWHSFGDVTLEEAAKRLVETMSRETGRFQVHVRDEANPSTVWPITLERTEVISVAEFHGSPYDNWEDMPNAGGFDD